MSNCSTVLRCLVLGLVELGINHEQQHQELLLMDIKHALSQNRIDPVYRLLRHPERESQDLRWIAHPGGKAAIGHDGTAFSYDNEGPAHHVWLEPFELASRTVTNGEVMAFIEDGGYHRSDLWLSDGWATVQAEGWEAPLYWRAEDGPWSTFTLTGRRGVDPHQPACHLSYYEADAIARYLGARLPTEAEWEAVAATQPATGNLLDIELLHPVPAVGDGSEPAQLFGDVWEWTGSAYLPYPGFQPAPGAVGEYNGKFMVNQHVLRGGSCVTPPGHVRPTYRNQPAHRPLTRSAPARSMRRHQPGSHIGPARRAVVAKAAMQVSGPVCRHPPEHRPSGSDERQQPLRRHHPAARYPDTLSADCC